MGNKTSTTLQPEENESSSCEYKNSDAKETKSNHVDSLANISNADIINCQTSFNTNEMKISNPESQLRLDLLENCPKQKEIKDVRTKITQQIIPSMNELERQTIMMQNVVDRAAKNCEQTNALLMQAIIGNMKVEILYI